MICSTVQVVFEYPIRDRIVIGGVGRSDTGGGHNGSAHGERDQPCTLIHGLHLCLAAPHGLNIRFSDCSSKGCEDAGSDEFPRHTVAPLIIRTFERGIGPLH